MGAIHWTGLVVLVIFVNTQVDGFFLSGEPAAVVVAAATADDDSVYRDGVTCLYPDDCQPDECCLTTARPREKRSARTKRWFFETAVPSEGVCQRLGTDGSRCIIPYNGVIPDPTKEVIAMEFSPCAAEFICVAGLDAAPTDDGQGEIGSCESKQTETENTDDTVDEREVADSNNEEPTDNDDPNENDNAADDDNNNYNADEAEPEVSEEKDEEEEKAEEWEEDEKPLENAIADFPADSYYEK